MINSKCTICPRNCGIDRRTELGFCKTTDKLLVARASLHLWEEPCISGKYGSGTIFFSGCNIGCVFCQNHKISRAQIGKEITQDELVKIFYNLKDKGAHNINLVTPTHFALNIAKAIKKAKESGFDLPFVYNSGGYENVSTLKKLDGLIDIFMPDFKYFSCDISKKYSSAENYAQVAKKSLSEMVMQAGDCVFDENGIMQKGVIVRHMMLPGFLSDSKKILKYLHSTYGDKIFLSIMSQFTPTENLKEYPEINRKVTKREYDKLLDYALELGIKNAFIQDEDAASESFIPNFDLTGIN